MLLVKISRRRGNLDKEEEAYGSISDAFQLSSTREGKVGSVSHICSNLNGLGDFGSKGGGSSRHKRGCGNGSPSHGQGRANFTQGRHSPRYQIFRLEGHYADRCRQRYERHEPTAQLAEAFTSSCSLSENEASNWFLDTEALAHMTPVHSTLDHCVPTYFPHCPSVLCTDPVDKSLKAGESLTGSSLQQSNPSPASLAPTELPPTAPVAATPTGSHHMLT
nr:hypothetical protein CFP56_65938 [Quercus suber]